MTLQVEGFAPPLFPALAGLAISLAGPPLIAWLGSRGTNSVRLAAHLACQAALVLVAGAMIVIAIAWFEPPLFHDGMASPGIATLGWGLGIAALFVFAIGPVLMRLPVWLGASGFDAPLKDLHRLPVWSLALAVLIGGCVEELLYRGFALPVLIGLTGSVWLGAGLTIVAFGLAHLPLWGWASSLGITIAGAILTGFYLLHGDLIANMLAHIVTDFVGIVLPALRVRKE
ncbi:MAG: CPBP family glutamic-type intramembrane protease [Pseudomonadota bacterium]